MTARQAITPCEPATAVYLLPCPEHPVLCIHCAEFGFVFPPTNHTRHTPRLPVSAGSPPANHTGGRGGQARPLRQPRRDTPLARWAVAGPVPPAGHGAGAAMAPAERQACLPRGMPLARWAAAWPVPPDSRGAGATMAPAEATLPRNTPLAPARVTTAPGGALISAFETLTPTGLTCAVSRPSRPDALLGPRDHYNAPLTCHVHLTSRCSRQPRCIVQNNANASLPAPPALCPAPPPHTNTLATSPYTSMWGIERVVGDIRQCGYANGDRQRQGGGVGCGTVCAMCPPPCPPLHPPLHPFAHPPLTRPGRSFRPAPNPDLPTTDCRRPTHCWHVLLCSPADQPFAVGAPLTRRQRRRRRLPAGDAHQTLPTAGGYRYLPHCGWTAFFWLSAEDRNAKMHALNGNGPCSLTVQDLLANADILIDPATKACRCGDPVHAHPKSTGSTSPTTTPAPVSIPTYVATQLASLAEALPNPKPENWRTFQRAFTAWCQQVRDKGAAPSDFFAQVRARLEAGGHTSRIRLFLDQHPTFDVISLVQHVASEIKLQIPDNSRKNVRLFRSFKLRPESGLKDNISRWRQIFEGDDASVTSKSLPEPARILLFVDAVEELLQDAGIPDFAFALAHLTTLHQSLQALAEGEDDPNDAASEAAVTILSTTDLTWAWVTPKLETILRARNPDLPELFQELANRQGGRAPGAGGNRDRRAWARRQDTAGTVGALTVPAASTSTGNANPSVEHGGGSMWRKAGAPNKPTPIEAPSDPSSHNRSTRGGARIQVWREGSTPGTQPPAMVWMQDCTNCGSLDHQTAKCPAANPVCKICFADQASCGHTSWRQCPFWPILPGANKRTAYTIDQIASARKAHNLPARPVDTRSPSK